MKIIRAFLMVLLCVNLFLGGSNLILAVSQILNGEPFFKIFISACIGVLNWIVALSLYKIQK